MTAVGTATLAVLIVTLTACDSGGSDATPVRAPGPDFEVFMDTSATRDEVDAVRQLLHRSEAVTKVRYVSREEAYRKFSRWFEKDQPDLVANTQPAELPESFNVTVSGGLKQVAARVKRLPGVDMVLKVPSSRPFCRRLAAATRDMSRADRAELTGMTRCLIH